MGKLTAATVKAISKPGRYGDGDTLFLNVAEGGTKSWVQRLKVKHGDRRNLGLGSFPLISLQEARLKAWENRKAAFEGHDVYAEKEQATKASKIPTFEKAAKQYYEDNKPRWKPGKHTDMWLNVIENYTLEAFWKTPVDRVDRDDVLPVLQSNMDEET